MVYIQKYRYAKYGNRASDYNGYIYDSGFEADYAKELDLRLKAKDIKSWSRQFKIELFVGDIRVCNYYCDFLVEHNDGELELVEIKGMETEIYRLKRKILEAAWLPAHPDYTYTVIKEKSNIWNRKRY